MKIIDKMVVASKGCYIHRKGSSAYGGRIMLYPDDTLDKFNEVDAIPEETSQDYHTEVERLIRERYTLGEELAIQRQRDTKPEEFNAYFQYCEECKQQAKQKMQIR